MTEWSREDSRLYPCVRWQSQVCTPCQMTVTRLYPVSNNSHKIVPHVRRQSQECISCQMTEDSSQKSSFGGPSPAQQPLMGQFMGAHQPLVGASGSGTRVGVTQPTPMVSILSVSVSNVCHVTRKSMQITVCHSSPVLSHALL